MYSSRPQPKTRTRFLLYSHDTYGLGHFRRSGLVASGLVGHDDDNEVLIVTGSPRAHAFPLPDRVDTVKLPSATKDAAGSYRPRKLGGPFRRLLNLRAELIASAVATYAPDVIVVDHAPVGMDGELAPTLDLIESLHPRLRPRLVLGLRDIIDAPDRVETAWHRDDIWAALDRYDDLLVYGDPQVGTTATDLDLARRTRATVTHTGYLAPRMPDPQTGEPFLLVTPGGGGDGQRLLRRFLDAAEQGATNGMRSVVVTGPLLSAARRAELLTRAETLPSVEVMAFASDMRSLISSASAVISMAGYNTVVEELAAGTPALLVPRCHPRLEQDVRARRLAPVTPLQHCPLDQLTAHRIRDLIETPPGRRAGDPTVDLAGVTTTVAALTAPALTPATTPTPTAAPTPAPAPSPGPHPPDLSPGTRTRRPARA